MPARRDLAGERFGRLVVQTMVPKAAKGERLKWNCLCDCGQAFVTSAHALQQGNTQSCGCLRVDRSTQQLRELGLVGKADVLAAAHKGATRHGMHLTKTYRAWNAMKNRCFNPKTQGYEHYGARGITVCDKWMSFEGFLEDMGEAPVGMTLDRYPDVNGNYELGNCRWASNEEQQNNKRNSRLIEYRGEVKTVAQWERELGYKRGFILKRLDRGWSIEDAFSPPSRTWERSAT